MTMGYEVTIRNDMLDIITAALDAGGGAAKLRIYAGSRPATGAAIGGGNTLGAELLFTFASAVAAASGTLTFSAINDDVSANNSINPATWFRCVTSADVFVLDGSVALSGADLNLNSLNIIAGVNVEVSDFASIINGNP